jgi:predicted CxxxxCH...CXXCH cytochrome family protein
MRTKALAAIIITGFVVSFVFCSFAIAANDTPHNASKNISCGSCHGEGLLQSFWGGSGKYSTVDALCLSCHKETTSGPYTDISAPFEKTHSSQTTSTKYGTWTRECIDCHNPHYQRQKVYKNIDAGNLYLATGKIQSCVYNGDGTSTFTYLTIAYKTGWDATRLPKKTGDYRGAILFPNVGKLGFNYPITAVDTPSANTITVKGDLTTECTNGYFSSTTFAVIYGQYIKDILDISPDGSGNNKTVKFFDQTGTNSFADGDTIYNGVCEVCHTQTTHFRNDGSGTDQNHTNIGGADGKNCITCHSHTEGFKPSCASCHGYPPPPLAAIPFTTGSTIVNDEHVFHVTTMGYQCSICHFNSVGSGLTHEDHIITLGFVSLLGLYTGGSYDGQTSANYESSDLGTTVSNSGSKECGNIYCHGGTMAPDGGTATAIWDNSSSGACGTCHGATAAAPPTRGSHTKHVGSASGGPQLACTVCHSGYTHINGSVEWAYDTATYTWLSGALYRGVAIGSASPVPSSSYGQCSNLYCHSIAQTSTGGALTPDTSDYKTPTWGQTFSGTCGGGACHAVGNAHPGDTGFVALTSGSHQKHLLYMFYQDGNCQSCHFDYSYDGCVNCHSRTVNHVDHSIDIVFNPEFPWVASSTSGTYSGDSVPANGFGSCSSLYCHSPGTKADAPYDSPNTTNITWGTTPLPGDCTGCHNGDNNTTNKMSTGSHLKHILSYDCSLCHEYTVSNSRTLNPTLWGTQNYTYGHRFHVDGWVTIVFDSTVAVNGTYAGQTSPITYRGPGSAYGSCTNITCHNDGPAVWTGGAGVGNTPTWGTTGGCNSCHGNTTYTDYRKAAPLYASYPSGTKPNAHQLHTDARTTPSGEPQCNNCHSSVTNSNTAIDGSTPSDHDNGAYNVVAGNTYKDGDNVGGSAGSVTTTYSYSGIPNTSTCSNVSCHPTGIAGTKAASTTKWSNAYSCTDCHNIDMNNTSGYHHVMDTNAMSDRTYPTSAPTGSATDSNRKCTMCHVDHNIFSTMLNVNNTNGRSYNLRTAIATTPTTTTGYTNTDYVSGGGICISCHTNELTKNTTAQKTETSSTVTMAVTDANFSASAHQYNVASTMANGSTTFNSNCSKCHNAKNNETTTFQSSANKFGVHDDTARRLVAALGGTLADPYEEAFCYRCHSKASDAIGGTKKSADVNDWYGAVTNMSAASTSIYQLFDDDINKPYKHNVAGYSGIHKPSPTDETRTYLSANKHVECDDCHNPHAAKAGLHSSNQVHVAAGTNLVSDSGPLTGATGAQPTSWSSDNWGGATGWPTTTSTATYEYQICFKCHASYNTNPSGWNSANTSWSVTTGPSAWTDVALEFNPNNNSYHPVVSALGNPGSSQLPPAFTSIVIGDSGLATSIGSTNPFSLTDSTKNWTTNQWQNWGLRIGWLGSPSNFDSSTQYNNVRTISSNTSNQLSFPAFVGTSFTMSSSVTYSIEYYAGQGTKSGNTVTDSTKHFITNNPYLPSPYLVGYVVVITTDTGTNVAKGTVTSCTDTSFTVDSWTNLPNICNSGGIPGDGIVGYYFSATGHTMMCSDCHSNDTISSTVAQGPHGSGVKWMLKGRNRAWPTTLASDNGTGSIGTGAHFFGAYTYTLYGVNVYSRNTNDGTVNGLFCLNCHSTVSFTKDGSGRQDNYTCTPNPHAENPHNIHNLACINCHIMVPHGGKMSRLIGDGNSSDNMPLRYAFNNTLSNMYVLAFTKMADPALYPTGSGACTVSSTACGTYHGGGSETW